MTTVAVATHIPPVIGFRQQFDAYYRGEVEKLKTRLKTTINNVQQNREDLENPIYLALKERAKYQFFKRVDPTRTELDVIKDLRPFAETMLDLLAQLLRFQFDGNLFKEKKVALEKHIDKERGANKLKDDAHLLNLTSAFFSHLDHIRVLGNINTHENRMKEETFVEYMMATLGALRMVTIFLDLLESTGFKLLAQASREKSQPKIQMATSQTKLPYPTQRPNLYDQYATPTPQMTPQPMYRDSIPTTLEQQMEVQQLLATMFPANQKMPNTAALPNIRQPTNIYGSTNPTKMTSPQQNYVPTQPRSSPPRYEAALQTQPDQIEDYNQAYYNEQMYNAHYTQPTYTTPIVPTQPVNKPLTPTITQQSAQYTQPAYTTQNVYPSRNTQYVSSQYLTATNLATEPVGFQQLSTTIRIKPSLTLDQAEFLKTEEDFEWTTIDFKREFCFLHFASGESASRALHYFDSIKQIPEYSFLKHYDASMYLKLQGKDEKRKY